MPRLRVKDFAQLAGVLPDAVYCALRGKQLGAAGVKVHRRLAVDSEHPLAIAYLKDPARTSAKTARSPKKARARLPRPASTRGSAAIVTLPQGFDPLAPPATVPAGHQGRSPLADPFPVVGERAESSGAEHRAEYVEDLAGELAQSFGAIRDLSAWTLGACVEKFGSAPGMVDHVKALKLLAELQLKLQQADVARGKYIERALVAGSLLPVIETAWQRVVGEAPGAMAASIVGLVTSGHEQQLDFAVEELIRAELSKILKGVRGEYLKLLDA